MNPNKQTLDKPNLDKPNIDKPKIDSDCCNEPRLISFEQAKEQLLDYVKPQTLIESIPLIEALNRVLAETMYSPIAVPAYANSAMDGYACQSSDLETDLSLTCIGKSLAGVPFTGHIKSGECVRIMTGAMLPEGADAVEMQENCQVKTNAVTFSKKIPKHHNLRFAGEDIALDSLVLNKSTQLKVTDIALLASLGLETINVYKKLKVAVFSTGDELQHLGKPLSISQIYDTNRITLLTILNNLNVETKDLGIIKDTPDAIQEALIQADDWADVVITTGGVSVGDADYVKPMVNKIGSLQLWKIALKPGKPFAYGYLTKSHFMGLPGNPVSALVTFDQLVVPFLLKFMGAEIRHPIRLKLKVSHSIKKRPGRVEFQRGITYTNQAGELMVKSTGAQGSGVMTSFREANCYIVLTAESAMIENGQLVEVELFSFPLV